MNIIIYIYINLTGTISLVEPSVASFGFHLSTKSVMVAQRLRQSLPRWSRPSPQIQGVEWLCRRLLGGVASICLSCRIKFNLKLLFFGRSSFFSSMSRSCFTSKCSKGHLWSLTGSSSMFARESKVNSILKLHLKLLLAMMIIDWGDVLGKNDKWCDAIDPKYLKNAYHLLSFSEIGCLFQLF